MAETTQTALARVRAALERVGVPDSRFEAELLVAHCAGLARAQLLAHPEWSLSAGQRAALDSLTARRAAREPLAYLLGEAPFLDFTLGVDARALIPRPETELLVEEAVRLARERSAGRRKGTPGRPFMVADVGTGSGAIAIGMARLLPEAYVHATDSAAAALELAARNARRLGVLERVELLQGDLLDPLPEPVDLVLANLPYVPTAEIPTLQPEVARYEPRAALDGGPDGLGLIRRLLAALPGHLRAGGAALFEIGLGQSDVAQAEARTYLPEAEVSVLPDLAGIPRVLVVATR
jgi:release factor glutamine methyltransferase